MSLRKLIGSVLSVTALAAAPLLFAASAQEAPANDTKPGAAAPNDTKTSGTPNWDSNAVPEGGMPRYYKEETPEQRRERLAVPEDPGINPDPKRKWWRFGKELTIQKFEKRWAKPTDRPGWIKPFAFVNFAEELYQENDQFVWVWMLEVEPPKPLTEEELRASQYRKVNDEDMKVIEALRPEFTPLDPPKAGLTLRFENSSAGLPDSGSWRSSLAVADMNGDGHADIILPPERGGRVTPAIFAGDGNGGWKYWPVKWPGRLNYGSVVAADFNKDRKMDLAFGIHLSGVVILLQEDGGSFREVERLANYPTRRVLARDVDADGWMDVVAISEGPIIRNKNLVEEGATNLRAYVNQKKGEQWTAVNIAGPQQRVSGDWLASGNFNGDKYPDFSGSTAYMNGVEIIYLSKGPKQWEVLPGGNDIIPWRSYYWATTAGRFSAKDRDDVVVSFVRQWIENLNPEVVPPPPFDQVVGLDRISFAGGTPKRTPIARWGGTGATEVRGAGSGDFDGDGHQDIIYTRSDTRKLHILLGDGKGGFREADTEGLTLNSNSHYDVQVADVNGDKRPDVVMMYEAESGTALARKNGKVEVFLNRGVAKAE